MKDQNKTKQKLIEELEALRKQVTKLKGMETKRKQVEEALQFTRFSLDNAADTMVCVDRDARFIDVNDAFCRSSGYSREELLSMTVHDIDPDYSAEIWPEFWEKLKQSGSLTFETCHRSKEGRIFPVEITANFLEYKGKEYHCSFARDITERKQAEELLKKSEERFRTSVKTLLEGFAILSAVRDSHGQIIDFKYDYINEAGCKMNQKPLEEHMGKTLLELLPTHKEIGLFDEYVRVVETGQSLTKEFLIYETVYGSGERLRQAFDVRITRLGDGFVTTWEDITDKKKGEELLRQSEERLKLLIENSKDVVIMADLEGSAMYYNGPPEYGITAEEVLGKNPFNLFEPAIAASLMNQLKLVIKGGEALTFENNIPGRGESFWFLNQMYPIRDEKDRMIAVGLIARNITERKRAEDREQLTHEVLNLLNRWETTTNTIREILLLFKKKMGFEALGIRLREDDDFPYFETNGFSEDFVQAERHLCAYDKEGKIVRDGKGNPVLECMCGNILCGRTDAALPFFTVGGSFWTNSTTDLLASTTEEDLQSRTRSRCNGEGYESVALIPLRSGDEIIGLLQLNDRRRNQFTPEMIHFFEGVGASIGIALSRNRAEEKLRESEEWLRAMFEHMSSGVAVYKAHEEGQDFVFKDFNPAAERITRITREQAVGHRLLELFPYMDRSGFLDALRRVWRTGQSEHLSPFYYKDTIREGWRENRIYKLPSGGVVAIFDDITERKQAEEMLRTERQRLHNVLETMPIMVCLLTSDYHVAFANRAFRDKFGESHGRYCYEYCFGKKEPCDFCEAYRVLKTGKPHHWQVTTPDGASVIDAYDFPFTDVDGLPMILEMDIDITERKRTEEALEKSIKLLNDTGEMAKVGGWELDLSTKEVLLTEELYRIHGLEPGYNLKLEEALDFYAPESRPDVGAVVKKAAETGEPYDLESLFIPSGSKDKIWVRSLGRAVYSGGKIVKLTGTFQNIDKYKRAEEALRVSLEKYRVLFESFPLGITISDKSGKIIEGNRQSEQLLGITREAHAQRRIDSKEWQIIRKDGTPMPVDEYASTRALRENRLIENVEMGIVKDKREITWISVTAAPIPLEGYGVAIAYGDITERKRAEEALRRKSGEQALLLDNIQTQIWYLTDKETYGAVNKARAEFFGKKNEEMENKRLYDVLSKDEAEICISGYTEVFEKRKQIHTEEWITNAKGEKRLLSIIKSPKLNENGDVEYVVCSAEDITERKRAEKERGQFFEQVHASRERLRNLSRRLVEVQEVERHDLVRKLHDEVGQSLTALSINLNIVHSQLPPETATQTLTRIDDSLKLVEETVERIRDVMAELRPPVLDDYGVSAALHWYGKQFSERTGTPTVLKVEELKPRLPLPEETALFRIAQEALTNVAKYAQAKNVTVGLEEFDKVIYLTIADDGVGFDPTAHHQQGARPEWGLINMRERAQTIGGTLNVETAPGKGTKIVVEIKRK